MKFFTLPALALFACTTAALAGPAEVPAPLPPVIIADEAAFEGFYVGLEYGQVDSEFGADIPFGQSVISVNYPQEGDAWGGFAGYNWQNGAMVYGAEARMLHFIDAETISTRLEDVFDLRGRVGYALSEDFLVYAAAGYSRASYWFAGEDTHLSGYNLGLGAEFNVTDALFLGVDYTTRELEIDLADPPLEGPQNTITLRAGFRF